MWTSYIILTKPFTYLSQSTAFLQGYQQLIAVPEYSGDNSIYQRIRYIGVGTPLMFRVFFLKLNYDLSFRLLHSGICVLEKKI